MQTEDRRACAACGASNRTDASSCWQCFARMETGTPSGPPPDQSLPVGGRPGSPTPPAMPAPMPPVSAAGRSTAGPGQLVTIVVGLIAAAGGFFLMQRVLGGGGVELPEALGGFPRMHNSIAEESETQMQDALADFDVSMDTGLYGSGVVPDFVVVVVEGRSLESTDAMFDEFVGGLTSAGAEVTAKGTSADLDGVQHRCVGLRAQGAQMGACMWQDDEHAGFVLQLDGTNVSTEALLVTIWPDLTG